MNAYEFNKISGAVLTALLVTTVIGFAGNMVIHPVRLHEPAITIEGVEVKATAAAPAPAQIDKIQPLMASANATAGQAVFKQCTACHTVEKGGPNRVGPNLFDVVGRKKAGTPGFSYSNAMQAMANQPGDAGVWTYEELNEFLATPRAKVPGTKMTFAGLRKTDDRANVIGYMRSQSDAPQPLP